MSDDIEIKDYERILFCALDYPAPDSPLKPPGKRMRESVHRQNNRFLESVIDEYTDFEQLPLYNQRNFDVEKFKKRIKDLLENTTENDLIVFYYHGKAGGEDKQYMWKFGGVESNKAINAHDLIQTICSSPADSIILLDCRMHTRLKEKFFRERGSTQIIHAGGESRDVEGEMVDGVGNTFTDGLIASLEAYAERTWSEKASKRKTWGSTIPQILGGYREMSYNPISVNVRSKPGKGCIRFQVGPSSKEDGKMTIRGVKKMDPNADEEEEEEEKEVVSPVPEQQDEGFVEGGDQATPDKPADGGQTACGGAAASDSGFGSGDDENELFMQP